MSTFVSYLSPALRKGLPFITIASFGVLPWFILHNEHTVFDIAKGYWRLFVEAHLCVILLSFIKSGAPANLKRVDELGEVIYQLQRRLLCEEDAKKALVSELEAQKDARDLALADYDLTTAGYQNDLRNEKARNATLQQVVKLLGAKVEEESEARGKAEEEHRVCLERLQRLEEEREKLAERTRARMEMQKIFKAALRRHAKFDEDAEIMVLHLDKAVADMTEDLLSPAKIIALNWNGETVLPDFGLNADQPCGMVVSAPQEATSASEPLPSAIPAIQPPSQSPSSNANNATGVVASACPSAVKPPVSKRSRKKEEWKPVYWQGRGPGWEAKFGPAPTFPTSTTA